MRTGPAEMALTRIFRAAEIDGEIAHRGLQRRLGDAHDVVVRHDAGRAAIGQRQHARRRSASAPRRACATSVKEKQEITMVRAKFSRVVSA